MALNPFTPANFFEASATSYTVLWSNSKTKTVYVETPAAAATMKPSIKSLTNPGLGDKTAFETSPFIEFIFFTNYIRNAIMQPTIPTLVQVAPFAV